MNGSYAKKQWLVLIKYMGGKHFLNLQPTVWLQTMILQNKQ